MAACASLAYARNFFKPAGRSAENDFYRSVSQILGKAAHTAARRKRTQRVQPPDNRRPYRPAAVSGREHPRTRRIRSRRTQGGVVGLAKANVHVFRDARAFMDRNHVPPESAPSESVYDWRTPRAAIIPPSLLYRYWPSAKTAAWTMWETNSLPAGSAKYLNKCGLLLIPSQWGVDSFRDNGVTVPMEVVPLGYDPGVFSPRARVANRRFARSAPPVQLDEGGLRKTSSASSTCSARRFRTKPMCGCV